MLLRFGDEEALQPTYFYKSRCGSRNPSSSVWQEGIGPWGLKGRGIGRGQDHNHVRQTGSGFCAGFSFPGRSASLRCRFRFGYLSNSQGYCWGCIFCSRVGEHLFTLEKLVGVEETREKPEKIGTVLAIARLENKSHAISSLSGLTSNPIADLPKTDSSVISRPDHATEANEIDKSRQKGRMWLPLGIQSKAFNKFN